MPYYCVSFMHSASSRALNPASQRQFNLIIVQRLCHVLSVLVYLPDFRENYPDLKLIFSLSSITTLGYPSVRTDFFSFLPVVSCPYQITYLRPARCTRSTPYVSTGMTPLEEGLGPSTQTAVLCDLWWAMCNQPFSHLAFWS